jgi:hypothetical protein
MSEEHGFVGPVRSFIEGAIDLNTTVFAVRAERRAEQPVTSAPPAEMNEDLNVIVARSLAAKGAHHAISPENTHRIIWLRDHEYLSWGKIHDALGVARSSARSACNRFKKDGIFKHRTGRHRSIDIGSREETFKFE